MDDSRDGDLRSSAQTETSILYRIVLPRNAFSGATFQLGTYLDLGVGGDGVIGRRVSLRDSQQVVGEGIMGWN